MKKPIASTALLLLVSGTFLLLSRSASAQVKLNWTDNSSNETQFVVERATATSGPWASIGTVGANTTSFTDNFAAAGTTYYYRVKASNGSWTSAYTNTASKTVAAVAASNGTGLKGQYYSGNAFNTLVSTTTDAQVNFDWGTGTPASSVSSDNFSVRWSGSVQTQEGGTYSFSTTTDDGVRLWVNGILLIDKWVGQGATTWSGNITLAANTKYSLKMEYFDATGGASAKLYWTRPGGSSVLIPKLQLFPS